MQLPAPAADAATYRDLIEHQLEGARQLRWRLQEPNLPAVRDSVNLFQSCFASLAGETSAPTWLDTVGRRALQRSFTALRAFQAHEMSFAAVLLLDAWSEEAWQVLEVAAREPARVATDAAGKAAVETWRHLGGEVEDLRKAIVQSLADNALEELGRTWGELSSQIDDEWLLLYNQAVGEAMARDLEVGRARATLRSLMTHLQVGQDELGRLFGVSGETVRRWERGAVEIPSQRQAAIFAVETSLRRLLEIFRPERLPVVVRREAEIFDGETALEWILRGRIADVVERYETAFLYQG